MLRAVILDSSAVARNLLSSLLVSGGHEVVGDGNLAPATLARIIKLKPQIVCIDVGESEDNGLPLIDQLREALPKALVFWVSARIDEETLKAAQAHGVHGFIVKPFNSVAVLGAIRAAVLRLVQAQRATSGGQDAAVGMPPAG